MSSLEHLKGRSAAVKLYFDLLTASGILLWIDSPGDFLLRQWGSSSRHHIGVSQESFAVEVSLFFSSAV